MKLGYELPDYGADGEFGEETKEALMDFQRDEGLDVDGEYGEKSHAALMDALSDEEAGNEDTGISSGDAMPSSRAIKSALRRFCAKSRSKGCSWSPTTR